LNGEIFETLKEAKVLIGRPHSSLGYMTPMEFKTACMKSQAQKGLSLYGLPDGKTKNGPEKEKPRDKHEALPISITTCGGARVSPQRCPILPACALHADRRAGNGKSNMQTTNFKPAAGGINREILTFHVVHKMGAGHRVLGVQASQKGRGVGRVDGGTCCVKKRTWGTLNGGWVSHDTRDEVIDFVSGWNERTEISAARMTGWLGLRENK